MFLKIDLYFLLLLLSLLLLLFIFVSEMTWSNREVIAEKLHFQMISSVSSTLSLFNLPNTKPRVFCKEYNTEKIF